MSKETDTQTPPTSPSDDATGSAPGFCHECFKLNPDFICNGEIRLLPCAHCWSDAEFSENENDGLNGMMYIQCTNPKCGMATLFMEPSAEAETKLAEIWNARYLTWDTLTLEDDAQTVYLLYPLPHDVALRIAEACRHRIADNAELLKKVLTSLAEQNTSAHDARGDGKSTLNHD